MARELPTPRCGRRANSPSRTARRGPRDSRVGARTGSSRSRCRSRQSPASYCRGTRNYIHDLPVRIEIGEVEVEGHRKIMGGPVTAVASRSARYVAIAPGKGDRDAISKKLASVFGVPIEEITRAMPPGSVEIVERHGIEA